MKLETRVAGKYAAALFRVANERTVLDRCARDVGALARLTAELPDLHAFIRQPRIPSARKKDVLGQVLSGKVDDLTSDFVQLLLDRNRLGLIEAIDRELRRLINEHRRILPAEATTALALEADQIERLRHRLSEVTGYEVQLTNRVDPAILGGLRVRMRGQLIDGSVATQLRRIREQWKQSRMTTG